MIFSHFFHVICHAKSERLSWCQNRTLFRTDDFLSSILFYSDSSDSFSVRRSMRTTLFLRFVFRETSRCTYVPIWLTYACMLKNETAFSWRNTQWIVLAVDFQKDSFERSLPFWFFIVAVLRPIFAQTLTASIFCFFAWSKNNWHNCQLFFGGSRGCDDSLYAQIWHKFRLKKQGMSLRFLDENRHRFVG